MAAQGWRFKGGRQWGVAPHLISQRAYLLFTGTAFLAILASLPAASLAAPKPNESQFL